MSKLNVNDVQQGMLLGESIYHPESKKLLLKQGTRLTNAYIEKLKALNIFQIEIPDRFTVFLDIKENMESLLEECYGSMLNKISSPYPEGNITDAVMDVSPVIRKAIKAICTNSEICSVCVDMQVIDFEALVRTGVFISGYSMLIAALMNMSEEEIIHIGTAALLHDAGMCEMFQLIRAKNLTPANTALWEQHPTYGYYAMLEKNFSREITELIYAHHEKYDGTGFPRGLAKDDIPVGSRIISLCADYEESIRNKGYLHYEAIEYIYGNSGISYDPAIVDIFTQNIPVYPLGSVIQLSTGDIGVVVNIRKNKGPRPVVRVQYNRVYKPISEPQLVDLGDEKTVFIKRIISY